MSRLKREDFFGNEKIIKLAKQISKKSKEDINYLNIKDKKLQKLLIDNADWLDYVGISVKWKSPKVITLKWEKN